MKVMPKIAGAAIAALALTGAGAATAFATSSGPANSRSAVSQEPTGPDTDAIQQGDQTTPDVSTAATAAHHSGQANAAASGEENGSENKSSSDGRGGHADASGNVQHEFTGVE